MKLLKLHIFFILLFSFFLNLILIIIFLIPVWASVNGPHASENIRSAKGVCANCHIPHYGSGPKIWAQQLTSEFDGIRRLCFSCHDGSFVSIGTESDFSINDDSGTWPEPKHSDYSISGIGDVFNPDELEDHVMHGAADIGQDAWLGVYDAATFPLDPDDEDKVPKAPAPIEYRKGGQGFYCGSCHNVHQQPVVGDKLLEDGDYLRTKNGMSVGLPGERRDFCVQCHNSEHLSPEEKNDHIYAPKCLTCHHPHKGYNLISKDSSPGQRISRAIFIFPVDPIDFVAKPNVFGLIDDINTQEIEKFPSNYCYACHQPHQLNEGASNLRFLEAGAAPIYGDSRRKDITDKTEQASNTKKEHHPMGAEATRNGVKFLRADDEAINFLNSSNQLTCTSCHAGLHGLSKDSSGNYMTYRESKENNFLRWNFKDDNGEFCIKCHSTKGTLIRGEADNKHFWKDDAPVPQRDVFDSSKFDENNKPNSTNYKTKTECRQCMLCHFIHDGGGGPDVVELRPDINALMRMSNKNPFALADQYRARASMNKVYYEDMCYGCHTESAIVRNSGEEGALLSFTSTGNKVFSHRYAISGLNREQPPFKAMKGLDFPIADGEDGTEIIDDYGTNSGEMYCGSCHDVHDPKRGPYLRYNKDSDMSEPDEFHKPYGFCEDCHNSGTEGKDNKGDFCKATHPIDKAPNNNIDDGSPTLVVFPNDFTSGGSGKTNGQVYGRENKVVCLTCHNVHAAKTKYDGSVSQNSDNVFHGKLLVKDNFENKSGNGSELCKACHVSLVKDGSMNNFPKGNHGKLIYAKKNYGTHENLQGGICSACHIPHNSIGNKIWSREGYPGYGTYEQTPFLGYRQLCFTCHNSSPGKSIADTGADTVFKNKKLEDSADFCNSCESNNLTMDHVMHSAAKVESSKILKLKGNFGTFYIPRDKADADTIPCENLGANGYNRCLDGQSCEGFYCGSCHNPHDQPLNETTVGNYLRVFISDTLVKNKSQFCEQCHEIDTWHKHETKGAECSSCHMVHGAPTRVCENEYYARDILIDELLAEWEWDFNPFRNLGKSKLLSIPIIFTENELASMACLSCHREGGGAAEDAINFNLIQHPIGLSAKEPFENSHATGTPLGDNLINGELACKSCHTTECEDGSTIDTAIRPCTKCHNDKQLDDKKDKLIGKHFVFENDNFPSKYLELNEWKKYKSELPPSPCLFCHNVHNKTKPAGFNWGDTRAEVDSLMRVSAKNLAWGSQYNNMKEDTDSFDYEDLCFGCHGNNAIVGPQGAGGSFFDISRLASHRFSIPVEKILSSSPTLSNMSSNKDEVANKIKFPLADGDGDSIIDDYGTQNGQFYCGSCHDVHDGENGHYLRKINRGVEYSAALNVNKGFCESCHDDRPDWRKNPYTFSDQDNNYIHPVDKGPNPPATVSAWPAIYTEGGSGKEGGIVTDQEKVICLTCHNVHACKTTWDNNLPEKLANDNITVQGHVFPKKHGKLLVKDNYSEDKGSNMCIDCHKTAIE